ncbi:MAG: nuclear transport factor 2 family protein [Paludibacteraceae bacterium]|nr:nuclear transport factor 2 family protein [Paludibacteraceae bacterium]MBR6043586.1 nuclear transport factor 2 family protein [Paludibacteraceae bacterium]MCR5570584.1 nuclear transport factor 2 family protein [Paludibacteraceae bacterium]
MDLEQKIQEITDRMALKQLVDSYAILADAQNGQAQKTLFTTDAVYKTYVNGELKMTLNGAEEIGNTMHNFLNTLDSVFHLNGQQMLNIKGDQAIGRCYCQITLVETQNGTQCTTQENVYYDDEYKKIDGKWLIAKRNSNILHVNKIG